MINSGMTHWKELGRSPFYSLRIYSLRNFATRPAYYDSVSRPDRQQSKGINPSVGRLGSCIGASLSDVNSTSGSASSHHGLISHQGPITNGDEVDYFGMDNRPIILYDGVCNLCNGAGAIST